MNFKHFNFKISGILVLLLAITGVLFGCSESDTVVEMENEVALPTLTTNAVTQIMETTAFSGGNITSDGGGSIVRKGLCWSTNENPTIADNRTQEDTVDTNFTSTMGSLNPGTVYFVRAYASNGAGTAYGNQVSFTTL